MPRLPAGPRALLLAAALLTLAPASAGAFEFFDGRLEIHGFYEAQIRGIARDMSANDNWDVTQWYNVLNVEIDLDIAPDGFGPFDLVTAFARVEARYDCIWTGGCYTFNSINVYGNNPKKFPYRYADGRESGLTGAVETGDYRLRHGIPIPELGFAYKDFPQSGTRNPAYIWHVPGVSTLFGVPGPDGQQGTSDDPAFYVFDRYVRPGEEYRFGLRRTKGPENGRVLQTLGPWEPRNEIIPIAALANRANPFNAADVNPIFGTPGSTELPFRPAPELPADTQGASNARSRGLWYPNSAVTRLLRRDEFDNFDQNFSEEELAWNRGASQQDEKELKEAYVDIEMFESRLWLRLGKQSIVWGKTELFRTTDQFNPQDIALSTLPNLEESRISLWSARGVWSFFTVGPFEDVRFELAMNFDQFEPNDIGRCGEPYTPYPACDKTAGLFAHGAAGFALAGEIRPPDPWESWKGVEAGARLEFRWDRFSFALTDFYGYEDLPYIDPVFLYERNVDPQTGRPRRNNSRAGCDPDGLYDGDTSGCLEPGLEAAQNHHANLSRFSVICGASVGFSELDRSVCAQSVFNSPAFFSVAKVAELLSWATAGSAESAGTVYGQLVGAIPQTVPLNQGPTDGPGQGFFGAISLTPGNTLTDQQEALIGCGRYWGTSCDTSSAPDAYGGIDLLNTDLSVLAQSWVGAPGTSGPDWDVTDPNLVQPGTEGFVGGPAGRWFEDGTAYTLPGARSPLASATLQDPANWNADVDGCIRPSDPGCAGQGELRHPFTGALFKTELAALSYNFQLLLAALSGLGKPPNPCPAGQPGDDCRTIDEFVGTQPYRTDGCSWAKPQLCSNIQALYAVAHTTRRFVRAGGSTQFGRMQFDWHDGGSGVLRYEKRNVLGLSMDFAEDRTKSTWSFEGTWIAGVPYEDNDQIDGLTEVDTYNLTISVDRPTFINFLNSDRTFFINTQWFFQYISGYREGFVSNGPFNVLSTLRVETGYYRDRLLPGITAVYDFNSASGAIIPEVAYRFTENLSATVSAAWFWGRWEAIDPPVHPVGGTPFRGGQHASRDYTENGLSPVSDRDEVSLIIRYTF